MKLRPFAIAALLATLILPPAGASASALVAEMAIEEVVVSATRRETSTRDIAAAVSVVTVDTIRQQKLVTDALADAPGAYLQQTTPGQGAAIVRGLKGSSILHLVDGLRLNNAIFRSAPTQYLALVPTTAVDHVEVIRGTPTSLYGSDAVGGAVQLVTRVPTFDTRDLQTAGEVYAGWDSAELGQTLRGRIDTGNDQWAGSVSVEHLETGDRRVGGGERIGPSGYESRAARLALALTPDQQSRWLLDAHWLEQPSTPRIDELVPGFGQTEPSSSEYRFEPNRRLYAHLQYVRDRGWLDLDWRASLAWQRIDDDRVTRNFEAPERRIETNRSDLSGLLLTAASDNASGSWIAGFEAYHDRVGSSRKQVGIATGTEANRTPRFPDGSTLEQAALFINGERKLPAGHAVSGGLRLSTVQVDLPQTAVSDAASVDTTDLSGDAGWRWNLDDRWQLVANLGYGFRAPNVFDLGTLGNRPGNRFNIPNTRLDSERVLQFDAGVRRFADGWQAEVMLFRLDYRDRITSVSTGATTADGRDVVQSVNAAESDIYGVEIAATVALGDRFDLDATLSYTRGHQQVGGESEPADRIPPLRGRLKLGYDPGGALAIDAWLRFANEQSRLSARDVRDVRINPNGTPGWATIGARADWRTPSDWVFSLGLDNVLDRRYRNHGSGIDAPGRNLSLSVRRSW